MATTSCEHCPTSTTECAPGWTWPLYTGACVACGRPSRTSAACGQPHCVDCRQSALDVETETQEQVTARVMVNAGEKIFPLWPIRNGYCSCPNGRRAEDDPQRCTSPGKHALFPRAHRRREPKCYGGCGREGHGLYDASSDLPTVTRWWARCPDAGIGWPAQGNDKAVIDVDPRHGGDPSFMELNDFALERGVDLTDTLAAFTGGGGMHYVYQAPAGGIKSGSNVFGLPGVDTRGNGGFIVIAPTLHVSGDRYAWVDFTRDAAPWPTFLTSLINPPPPILPSIPAGKHRASGSNPTGYAEKALQDELDILANKRGGRNDQLNISAFNLGQLVGAGLLTADVVERELYSAAIANGYVQKDGERETMGTINSGLRSGMSKPRVVRT